MVIVPVIYLQKENNMITGIVVWTIAGLIIWFCIICDLCEADMDLPTCLRSMALGLLGGPISFIISFFMFLIYVAVPWIGNRLVGLTDWVKGDSE